MNTGLLVRIEGVDRRVVMVARVIADDGHRLAGGRRAATRAAS